MAFAVAMTFYNEWLSLAIMALLFIRWMFDNKGKMHKAFSRQNNPLFLLYILPLIDIYAMLIDKERFALPISYVGWLFILMAVPVLASVKTIRGAFVNNALSIFAFFITILSLYLFVARSSNFSFGWVDDKFMALAVIMSIFIFFNQLNDELSITRMIFNVLTVCWLCVFIISLDSFLGVFLLFIIVCLFLYRQLSRANYRIVRITIAFTLFMAPIYPIYYISELVIDYYGFEEVDYANIPQFTDNGNVYYHNLESYEIENGHYTWLFVCESELKSLWNKKSAIAYDGNDKQGNLLKYTLIRYLASKGLTKDSSGLSALNSNDIGYIERGIPNYLYVNRVSIRSKLYRLIWNIDMHYKKAYSSNNFVNEYLSKASILKNFRVKAFIIGVGRGSLANSIDEYTGDRSLEHFHLENTYLNMLISYGILSTILFLALFIYIFVYKKRYVIPYAYITMVVLAISMLFIDVLENSSSIIFIGFFMLISLKMSLDNESKEADSPVL